jgi:glutamine amidotransferase
VFNMLLSDGRYVMAFCSTNLHWITGGRRLAWQTAGSGCGDRLSTRDHTQRCGHRYRHAAADGNETWHKIMPGEWALFVSGTV